MNSVTRHRLIDLGTVREQTRGLFLGDYFDGVLLPIFGFKPRPD